MPNSRFKIITMIFLVALLALSVYFSPDRAQTSPPDVVARQQVKLGMGTMTSTQNLLENPGFEQQLTGWSTSDGSAAYTAQTQTVHAGTYSAKGVETSSGSLGRLYQEVTSKVVVGQQYKISGWIKTEGITGQVIIGLDYVTSGGWTPGGGYIKGIGYVSGTKDWTYYESVPFTMPAMPAEATALWVLFDFNAGAGTAYWDDVALMPVPSVWLPTVMNQYAHFDFDFKRELFGTPSALSVTIGEIDTVTGRVVLWIFDSQPRTEPYTFDWGDGIIDRGWSGHVHTYSNRMRNYVIRVAASETDTAKVAAYFVPPTIMPVSLPSWIAVTIPNYRVPLSSRMAGYGIPSNLTYFDDSFFAIVPRSAIEYLLSVAAWTQYDLVNGNVFLPNGKFNQVLLRDPAFSGMYSLWYTTPVCFGVGDYGFRGPIQYSSFFHEMGHNFTLNSPANYYYGGKIDGNANAIYSETMAQIFAHAVAFEMFNNYRTYGLSDDLVVDAKESSRASMRWVRTSYENYLASGKNFYSWNDPSTSQDETFDTFMTIAYKFFVHAEGAGQGYRIPARRMTRLLGVFNENLHSRYDQDNNTPEAATFRATLMVTALSYAFSTDLRAEFRDLNFPISDDIYNELYSMVPAQ